MANRRYTSQFSFSFHAMPVSLHCSFIVTPTNGLGVTSLVGPGISSVWMNSSSPTTGNNLAAGQIQVNLQDPYFKYYGGSHQISGPVTGSAINISDSTVLTIGSMYEIVTVGTSTVANWVAAGVPVGVVPAVGVRFVAAITGAGTGTGTVKAVATSGIYGIELMGNPNLTIPKNALVQTGGILFLGCVGPTNSSTTTSILKAPTTGSLIHLVMNFSNSSVLVGGE